MNKLSWTGLILSILIVGCGSNTSGTSDAGSTSDDAGGTSGGCPYSCNSTASAVCIDFVSGFDHSNAAANCSLNGADYTFSSGSACTAAGRIGSCAVTSSASVHTYRYFSAYSGGGTGALSAAKSDCAGLGGAFTLN